MARASRSISLRISQASRCVRIVGRIGLLASPCGSLSGHQGGWVTVPPWLWLLPQDFIEEWYTELNKLDLPEAEKERIVDEANYVFTLNIYILDELEGNALAVAFKLAVAALKERLGMAV